MSFMDLKLDLTFHLHVNDKRESPFKVSYKMCIFCKGKKIAGSGHLIRLRLQKVREELGVRKCRTAKALLRKPYAHFSPTYFTTARHIKFLKAVKR